MKERVAMKFIHIADVHLGAAPDAAFAWSKDREREIWETFDALISRVRVEKADFLLIAGDLFHRQPLMRELKELNYRFEKLSPTRVIVMAGNHDYLKPGSSYLKMQWAKNVCFFTDTQARCLYFEDKQTYIYGLSYTDYEVTEAKYDRLCPVKGEGCHILLAHGGDAKHIPMKYEQIYRSGFDYVAMGHIHKPQMMFDGHMAYAGALSPIDKDDIGPHGYVLGSFADGQLKTSFVPFAKRSYVPVEIAMEASMPWSMALDYLRVKMESAGMDNIFKVTVTGYRDPEIEVCPGDIYALARVVEVNDESRPDYDFDALYVQNKDNLIGMFIDRVRILSASETSKEKALYYGIRALLGTMEK